MKRIKNIFPTICTLDNLVLADQHAQKGKGKQPGVIAHNLNRDDNLKQLQELLLTKQYKTSAYDVFKIYEPKEREVYRLPYFPDRIVHHAILNVLEPVFTAHFTADTYSSIKGKGIHNATRNLQKALKDKAGTTYCLKLDIKKFYPSVNHDLLKALLLRKFKDQDLLWLLFEIIDSADGLPIGNYLSQYFANFYLSGFDHFLKETRKVKYYFRYADDLVFLADDKAYLHQLLADVRLYLHEKLKLTIKDNYQVFPVDKRGIDFVGYRFYHTHTLLRKSIKKNFARAVHKGANGQTIASYRGWCKHCNARNLLKKLLVNHETESIQRARNNNNDKKFHR